MRDRLSERAAAARQPGAAQPRLAVVGSKNGSLYALNRDNLGYPAACVTHRPACSALP
jgi:hypothetical protein